MGKKRFLDNFTGIESVEDEKLPQFYPGFLQGLKNNDLASVHNHVDIQPWRTIFALDFGCIFFGGFPNQ